MLIDSLSQGIPVHVRIYFRSGNIGMSQHRLDSSQIRPAPHHVGREAVPQHMGAHLGVNSSQQSPSLEADPESLSRHSTSPPGDEDEIRGLSSEKGAPRGFEIFPQAVQGDIADRNKARLITFAGNE